MVHSFPTRRSSDLVLDRILPAMFDQRAADEHDRRDPIDHAELAERIGDIDFGVAVRQLAERTLRELEPRTAGDADDAGAALWMARHQDRQQAREAVLQP